jgi:uncharacterized membrane protein
MNETVLKVLKILIALIAVVAASFLIAIIATGDDAIVEGKGSLGIVGPLVSFATVLLYLVAGTTVVFSILSLLKKPEALKKTGMGLGVLLVLLAISYGLASDQAVTDVTGQVLEGGEAGAPSRWVSTRIWYTLLLGLGAVVSILTGGTKKLIK